jgi:hypothetical protein
VPCKLGRLIWGILTLPLVACAQEHSGNDLRIRMKRVRRVRGKSVMLPWITFGLR